VLDGLVDRLASPEHQQRCDRWEAEQHQREAALRRAENAAAVWRRRGLRYEHCTLDNYQAAAEQQQNVVAQLRRYVRQLTRHIKEGTNIVLVGPAGTGKDHLLAGMVHEALRTGLSVRWECGSTLSLAIRQAIQNGSEAAFVSGLVRPAVLVLSDPVPPHVEPSNYERSILYAVIDRRYSALRPTWISLNAASRQDAEGRLGLAVADRLRDGALSLACNWPSWRRPLKEAEV